MDEFKLKSPDEFDSEFVAKQVKAAPVQPRENLIPEMAKDEPIKEIEILPVEEEPAPAAPAVNISGLYTSESMNNGIDLSELTDSKEKKKKKSKGALAGKIVSIILLVLTVVVFIIGCFISVFLDNKGSNIAGITFNTVSQDIEKMGLSKGDLVIAKKLPANEYAYNDFVAYPSVSGDGCDVFNVQNVTIVGDTAQFILSDPTGYNNMGVNYDSTECLGSVTFYIPLLGGIISFAINNAILVCALFILLAALWCLLLILIEKSESKSKKDPEEETME